MSKELDDAVDSAMDKAEETEESTQEEAAEEEISEETSEETSEDGEEEGEEELSAEQLKQAKGLYKLLTNPETSVAAIQSLVNKAGYTLAELKDASKSEKQDIASDILGIFKETLGDDFDLLGGSKLAEALAKVLDTRVKPLQTKLEQAEFDARKKEVDTALDWAYDKLPGFKENESLIADKMSAYPYSGKVSYKTYLKEIYAIVTASTSQKRSERAASNLKTDVKASKSVRSSATKPAKSMSLEEAIEMALADAQL